MKSVLAILLCCVFFFLLGVTHPAAAEDSFHITYQLENLSSDNETLSGDLLLHVVNVSGQAVQDLAVRITEPNRITYDNRMIYVGDLEDGQPKGVLDHFRVPKELQDLPISEGPVVWKAKFTNQAGERVEMDVEQVFLPYD